MYMNILEWSEWTSANETTVLGILETKYWENSFKKSKKTTYVDNIYLKQQKVKPNSYL